MINFRYVMFLVFYFAPFRAIQIPTESTIKLFEIFGILHFLESVSIIVL